MRRAWLFTVLCVAWPSGCASSGSIVARAATVERSIAPSRFGASPQSTVVRLPLEGGARWLVFDPAHPEQLRSFALDAQRPRVDGELRRALPEEGTFEIAAGWAFDRVLAARAGEAWVLARWSQAQGAVDPRTSSESLVVLRVGPGRVEPAIECRVAFSVTQGPDRETTEEYARSVQVEGASIALREGSRRSRAVLEGDRWRLEGAPWCASLL